MVSQLIFKFNLARWVMVLALFISLPGGAQKKIRSHSSRGKNVHAVVSVADNLKQCKMFYNKIGLAKIGNKKCLETARKIAYGSPNYQACFKIYGSGGHAKDAPATCAILTQKFQFQENPTFQKCYLDQKKKMNQENAATACMNYVNNLNYLRGLSS